MLRIPVPFNRYAEDVFHNPDGYVSDCTADIDGCDDHGSIADWIPVAPQPRRPSKLVLRDDRRVHREPRPTRPRRASSTPPAGERCRGRTRTAPASLDTNKYQSLVLANYCIRLEVTGQTGCYDKGVAPFPNKGTRGTSAPRSTCSGPNYETYPTCDTTWQGCGDAPANLPVWPADLLGDITPGATLSSNFSRLRHPWMTLWWTHFDPTLLVTGDPTAQKDEYFTRSLFWSNDND